MTFNTIPDFHPIFVVTGNIILPPTQAEESSDFQLKGIGGDLALKWRSLTTAVTPAMPGHQEHTTKVQDEVASSGSHLPQGLLSHFMSSQIRCRQHPAPEQAGKVAMKDGSRFCPLHHCFPYSLWYRTCQNHQLQAAANSTATSLPAASAELPAGHHQGWGQWAAKPAFSMSQQGNALLATWPGY